MTNSLATRSPSIAGQLDHNRNGDFTADQIVAGSNQKFWWRCPAGPDHVWLASVGNRTMLASACPTCAVSGYKPGLPGFVYLLGRSGAATERKIGISNFPDDRTADHGRRGWHVLEVSPALDGLVAYQVEQAFLRILAAKGLRRRSAESAEERYDGYTEIWAYDSFLIGD